MIYALGTAYGLACSKNRAGARTYTVAW